MHHPRKRQQKQQQQEQRWRERRVVPRQLVAPIRRVAVGVEAAAEHAADEPPELLPARCARELRQRRDAQLKCWAEPQGHKGWQRVMLVNGCGVRNVLGHAADVRVEDATLQRPAARLESHE